MRTNPACFTDRPGQKCLQVIRDRRIEQALFRMAGLVGGAKAHVLWREACARPFSKDVAPRRGPGLADAARSAGLTLGRVASRMSSARSTGQRKNSLEKDVRRYSKCSFRQLTRNLGLGGDWALSEDQL